MKKHSIDFSGTEGVRWTQLLLPLIFTVLFCVSCGRNPKDADPTGNEVHVSMTGRVNTLDPVLAADTVSQKMICAFYDTLLQYHYRSGQYQLEPSMLAEMPEMSPDGREIRCVLRDDLYFQECPALRGLSKEERRVTARDVIFSFLRLADARIQSPGYWVIRGKIKGVDSFYKKTQDMEPGDYSVYDEGCEGLAADDDLHFRICLEQPDPRFLYSLALPYCATVSRTGAEKLGESLTDNPAGSGPFSLEEWKKDYSMLMKRNPDFRKEFYGESDNKNDASRPLPLADQITVFFVKQPLAAWLLFLQGELDYYALDGENFEAVVGGDRALSPALLERGISMLYAAELETNYIGFNFADPLLAGNLYLRKAISCAFDKNMRVIHSGGRFVPASGPVPPGVPGALPAEDAHAAPDLELAREYMKKAGFPDGIDPKTGQPLEISFDQSGSGTMYAQLAELMALDMEKIGIRIRPEFNTRSRFLQKLKNGDVQLFRFSWTGDYPDAENFLQLFYGPNAGSCNRVMYRDPEFDAMFEEIAAMADSPERTAKYEKMSRYLTEQCPWIFETHTSAFVLKHEWLSNYRTHSFAFNRWKYLSVDPGMRAEKRRDFRPMRLSELKKKD